MAEITRSPALLCRYSLTKSVMHAWRIILVVLALGATAHAQETKFPDLTGRVVDLANILDAADEAALTSQLEAHEQETSNQIVIATVPSLNGYAINDYANQLGRHWQIGTAENDNGVVLLIAPTDRKVRIEVGYGLEGALTDSLSSMIIQREILPPFRDNNYSTGIKQGVIAIISAIKGEYVIPEGSSASGGGSSIVDAVGNFIPLIFIAMVGIPEILKRRGMRRAANGAFPAGFAGLFGTLATGNLLIGLGAAVGIFLLIYFTGGNGGSGTRGRRGGYSTGGFSSGGGGGGGGGFSGGGGSFGGGGASGSW